MKLPYINTSFHNHTIYSLVDAVSTPEEMIKAHADAGCAYVGLSDHGHISNFFRAEEAAKKYGVTWIAGCEFYVFIPELKTYGHLTVLAKNDIGKKNLYKLFNKSWDLQVKKWGKSKPMITWDLLESCNEGLFAGTGCFVSVIGRCVSKDNLELAESNLDRLLAIFGKDRLFCEIIPHKIDTDWNSKTREFEPCTPRPWAQEGDLQKGYQEWLWQKAVIQRGLKPVVTLDAHFTTEDKKPIQDAILATGENSWRFARSHHILSSEEIYNNLIYLPNFNVSLYEQLTSNGLYFCEGTAYTETDRAIKLAFEYPSLEESLEDLGNRIKPSRIDEILKYNNINGKQC